MILSWGEERQLRRELAAAAAAAEGVCSSAGGGGVEWLAGDAKEEVKVSVINDRKQDVMNHTIQRRRRRQKVRRHESREGRESVSCVPNRMLLFASFSAGCLLCGALISTWVVLRCRFALNGSLSFIANRLSFFFLFYFF